MCLEQHALHCQAKKQKEEEEAAAIAKEAAAAVEATSPQPVDADKLNKLASSELPDDETDEEADDADPK